MSPLQAITFMAVLGAALATAGWIFGLVALLADWSYTARLIARHVALGGLGFVAIAAVLLAIEVVR